MAIAALMYGGLVLALAIISTLRARSVAELLRDRHPEHWDALCRGYGPLGFVINKRSHWLVYLMRRRYLEVDDPELATRCERLRTFEVGFAIFLLVGVLVIVGATLVE